MIRAIMNGCHGVMGHVITDIISKDDAIEIVAGVDMNTETYAGYPVFKSLAECPEADVIIDFSTAITVRRRRFRSFYVPQDFLRIS